ncbi:MAG: tripartite tricarboxylate transporter family receptor [Hyphomicrobiales bacterium]|nr:tripartite tricarboxylate transporter family receptor [Hyphomicrobiales bacterium]
MSRISFPLLAAAALALGAAPASADAVADFYKGKNLSIWVGYGTGGGYDTTARLVSRHIGRHIPGNPTVVVQNVTGAGSLLAANNLYNVAPKDGSVLGVFSSTVAMMPLYRDVNAKFDTLKFNWIGNLHRDTLACGVWKGAGQNIRTLEDLIAAKQTVVFGSDGGDAPLTRWPLFMKNVLGANLKVVAGYKGTREINLAMQSGEAGGSCGMFESTVRTAYANDYKNGDLVLFVQTGFNRNVEYFGKATNIYSLLKTDEEIQMAKLVFGVSELTRPLAAPPGVPADRVAALRKALMDMAKDPVQIEEARKIGTELSPMSGEEILAEFETLFKTPWPVVEKSSWATSKP